MNALLQRRLALLSGDDGLSLVADGLRGIEREALRVDRDGRLAMTGHPAALGAALTHPSITTDYAEALIELITSTVAPPTWDGVGGSGNIKEYQIEGLDALVITQTEQVHDQVERLLSDIRRTKKRAIGAER